MPKVSVIIPVYNTEAYVSEALESALGQTLSDIEILVVDDGSTDGSSAVLQSFASRDQRIKVIAQHNMGLHLARATGVKAATGEYCLFLDSDDKLDIHACERLYKRIVANPVDMLHFGVGVFGESEADKQAAKDFEHFANSNLGRLYGSSIPETIFDEILGYRLDWRTWQRLFPTTFLKRAFSQMSSARLDRAEDSHEGFVLACLAQSFDSMDDYQGYRYRYGRGVSVGGSIDASSYRWACLQFSNCLKASERFAKENPSIVNPNWLAGLRNKCLEILANDWLVRVPANIKALAFESFIDTFGGAASARELYRIVRDRAYELFVSREYPDSNDILNICLSIVESIELGDCSDLDKSRLQIMRQAASRHMEDIRKNQALQSYDDQSLRLFVTMHDSFAKPDDPIFQPVQVGPGQLNPESRFAHMFHDGDGDNISRANPRYCEMTVQYWAWRNVKADYYGFCHYRRYFNFSDIPAPESPWGEVEVDRITPETCERFGLDSKTALRCIGDADVLMTEIKDVSTLPDHNNNLYEHYRNGDYLHIADLDTLIEVIADTTPEYMDDVQEYLSNSRSAFCNMYIMKRNAFHDYCSWVFPILEEFERRADMKYYSKQEMRVTGHLAERLFNIYLLHNQRSNKPWKTKEVQCVRFRDPNIIEPLRAASTGPVVPVVFAADDSYSPMLATAIHSLVKHTSRSRFYDIVVLSRGISPQHQQMMQRMLIGRSNVSLRFFNVGRLVEDYELTVNEHITEETYYRFLIQWILPDYPKVLYLDSDLVVNADVADLFDTELGNHLLAAVIDVDWAGICNVPGSKRKDYAREQLGMQDPYSYFQAGVLLLNTSEMAKLHNLDEWLKLASVPRIYNDQDVLNMECEGRVRYLDLSWNVLVDTGRLEVAIQHAPVAMHEGYLASRACARIIHYAGAIKPWQAPDCDYSDAFWDYARETPFYEALLLHMATHPAEEAWYALRDRFLIEQGTRSLPRKVADVVAPYGSKRRESLRHLAGRE